MRRSRILPTLVVPMLWTSAAAAMTVTTAGTPPAADVILARDVGGDVGSYTCDRGIGAESQIGQTFRLSTAADLDRVTLRLRPQTEVAGTLVTLFFGTFADEDDVTMDTLLAAETAPLPQDLALGEEAYVTFDVADRRLDADRQYGFVLGFTGGDHPGQVSLDVLHVGGDLYAGGQAIEWSGLQETALAADLVFYIQGPPGSGGTSPPPYDDWIASPDLPGFAAQVRITPAGGEPLEAAAEADCIAETICAHGALPGRPELFVKVIGPRPNGYLWVQLIRFTPSEVDVWLRQTATGEVNHYHLAAVTAGDGVLPGLEDRTAFLP